MSKLLSTLFEIENFTVININPTRFSTISDQIEIIQPDIIIMDIHLNGNNGLEILRNLKLNNITKNSKVIVCSGDNQMEEAIKAGAEVFFLKPYMPSDLLASIHSLLKTNGEEFVK
ncbi:MAG: hypothetical protein BGO78_01620 [Chloroflexi bacterium 44-23]|nr:MAG: hypothetical protein BGO78_01620 [Chloroflexi bacterium 44-23]